MDVKQGPTGLPSDEQTGTEELPVHPGESSVSAKKILLSACVWVMQGIFWILIEILASEDLDFDYSLVLRRWITWRYILWQENLPRDQCW